jgi:hypothetical protein
MNYQHKCGTVFANGVHPLAQPVTPLPNPLSVFNFPHAIVALLKERGEMGPADIAEHFGAAYDRTIGVCERLAKIGAICKEKRKVKGRGWLNFYSVWG